MHSSPSIYTVWIFVTRGHSTCLELELGGSELGLESCRGMGAQKKTLELESARALHLIKSTYGVCEHATITVAF